MDVLDVALAAIVVLLQQEELIVDAFVHDLLSVSSLVRVQAKDLVVGCLLVGQHWLPNEVSVDGEGSALELEAEVPILVHQLVEDMLPYRLAIEVGDSLVQELRSPAEH